MFQYGKIFYNYFPTISETFRNVKLGIIVLKKMFFPLQKNELI